MQYRALERIHTKAPGSRLSKGAELILQVLLY